ncbi:MAG: DUF2894 domain-containing protein [Paraburkholderia sp.]|nr:MAG: DUF2894 domain-containing protein [Paraburkholderia sp.]
MSSDSLQAQAMLDAWRAQGADRIDPVRFRFIEALARRAASQGGAARHLIETKLCALLEAYRHDLENAAAPSHLGAVALSGSKPTRGPLAELTDYLASHAQARSEASAAERAVPVVSSYPELPALDELRALWAGISAQKQLRQSLAQVPGNAGPLNSSSLVHRALSLMHDLSPGYLQQFLSYVDALSCLESMGGGAASSKHAPRAEKPGDTPKKRRRSGG